MKGSISAEKDRGRWVVSWFMGGRIHKVRRYRQQYMPITAYKNGLPDQRRCHGYKLAQKLLALMQARWEQHEAGKCRFDIAEFTGDKWSDVCDFYEAWMAQVIEPNRKPATVHCYWSYYHNWIKPFFADHPAMLHEVQLDTVNRLLNTLRLEPKGKLNVVMALRSMFDYAWRCGRIPTVPPFPRRGQYGIVQRSPEWLTSEQREAVMAHIPADDRPIFDFLAMHYRRPGEACVLHKADYDQINNAFWIRRTLSHRKVVETTKTYAVHYVPCDALFVATVKALIKQQPDNPYMFINPRARKDQKRYTLEALRVLWYAACDAAGVRRIWVYRGTKHTSCTQFIENGGTIDELQMLTGHARRDSLAHYAEVTLSRKRAIMERNRKATNG